MSKFALFNALKSRIDAIPGWNCPDLWNGQPSRESEEDVIRYPAAYIHFSDIAWSSPSGPSLFVQTGDVEITIYLVFKRLDKENFKTLQQVDEVFSQLQGWSDSDLFSALRRVGEAPDIDYDNVEVWSQRYVCQLVDTSAHDRGSRMATITDIDTRTDSELCIDDPVIRTGKIESDE